MLRQKLSIFIPFLMLFQGCLYQGPKSAPKAEERKNPTFQNQGLPDQAEVNYKNLHEYILKPKCISCHSGVEPDGDVDLTSYDALLNHPYYFIVVAGSPDESSLYMSVLYDDMPPKSSPLSEKEKNFIKSWIEENAPQ